MSTFIHRLALSPAEAAEMLGVSKPTVYKLIHQADFPALKVGTRTLIPIRGLTDWLEKQGGEGWRK